jgi:uncharacterized repeat protein (TIGR01451 family)
MRFSRAILTLCAVFLAMLTVRPASAAPVLRHQVDQKGDFSLIGNTLGYDCGSGSTPVVGTVGACGTNATDDTGIDILWNADSPASGQAVANNTVTVANSRSTAVLKLPAGASVTYARLYWSAFRASADNAAVITVPSTGGTQNVTADATWTATDPSDGTRQYYQATADITAFVQQQGPTAYRVSGVNMTSPINLSEEVAYSAWTLVVFYADSTQPLRNLAIFDGLDIVNQDVDASATLSGFQVPVAGFDAKLGVIAYEGDGSVTGDALVFNGNTLSDAQNPANNFFNGSRSWLGAAVTVPGDLPQMSGASSSMQGVDFDVVNVTAYVAAGSTSATISATSSRDVYLLGAFITSVSTLKPDLSATDKTVTDVNGGTVLIGDPLEYVVSTTNAGTDPSVGTVLTDVIPAGTTYVPGSLKILTGANAGTKTDAAGDDQGEYVAATRTLTVRLGTGANATQGGTLVIGASTSLSFRVTYDGTVAGTITNQAVIQGSGQNGAPPADWDSDGNGTGGGTPPTTIDPDTDGDGILDSADNCPTVANATQEDLDQDGQGDACDLDIDDDGVANTLDNCPRNANPLQEDLDIDDVGDVCDPDIDGDGDLNGTDCAPRNAAVHHGATETCNNEDDNCNGSVDEGLGSVPSTCGTGACVRAGVVSCVGGVYTDSCVSGVPGLSDATCDGVDDNCNGSTDEGYVGTATACGVGACARVGVRVCVNGDLADTCSPGAPAPSDATCDGVDDNCNGQADEGYVPTATSCGVGACERQGFIQCVAGVQVSDCIGGLPVASDTTCNGVDEDCNGVLDDGYAPVPSSCGTGACAATGSVVCFLGAPLDLCEPGFPVAATDTTCDGVDDDCNGGTDDGYIATLTECGVGACAAEGLTTCVAGVETDGCAPGQPALADTTCDGIDDDCNESVDDGYVAVASSCGTGACAATATVVCFFGAPLDLCEPGFPVAATDTTCDGVDDDCNGGTDDGYVGTATACGTGACAATGALACVGGDVVDTCEAGTFTSDANCNGIDNDCDGVTDDEYVPTETACGVGACARAGTLACQQGDLVDSCAPGTPAADTTCNGADEDCDGTADDGYVPTATACGVGACAAVGVLACTNGLRVDTCLTGIAVTETCNGLDDNCNGRTDEGFVDTDEDGLADCVDPDLDDDDIPNGDDNCPTVANPDQADLDEDGLGDACDDDLDGDEVPNVQDNCPRTFNTDQVDTDRDGVGDACTDDWDGDGVLNGDDNCPLVANPDQADLDDNGVGDACDGDKDGDGILDGEDNCPTVVNPEQEDQDDDGLGDACDPDRDGDGIPNVEDNCPTVRNAGQADGDRDGIGDACDPDRDGDGIFEDGDGSGVPGDHPCAAGQATECDDNCPDTANADQADQDKDGLGDACDDDVDGDGVPNGDDNCPLVANPDQADLDENGVGDACDGDKDGDGIPDATDNCPTVKNADQPDLDKDGLGDACDDDWDGDGILNDADNCPTVKNADQADTDRDGRGDACDSVDLPDGDGDGIPDLYDNCPTTVNADQRDLDRDGKGDACDDDVDGDGVANAADNCPWTVNPAQVDTGANGVGDACDDRDGDGVGDLDDNCPDTANSNQRDLDLDRKGDVCDDDADGDGVANAVDNCPWTANRDQKDTAGTGEGDVCSGDVDGDGVANAADNCPKLPNAAQKDLDDDGVGDLCQTTGVSLTGGMCSGSPVAPASGIPGVALILGLLAAAWLLARRSLRPRAGVTAAILVATVAGAFPGAARAQEINVQSFEISPFRQDLITVGKGFARDQWEWNVGVMLEYQNDPLVLRSLKTGDVFRNVVQDQLSAHVFGAVALLPFLDVGLVLPVIAWQRGDGLPGQSSPKSAGVGDLRLHLRFMMFQTANKLFSLSLTPVLTFPTGRQIDRYMGASTVTITPWLNAGLEWARAGLALNLGYRPLANERVYDLTIGDQFLWRLGGWVGLMKPVQGRSKLDLIAELDGAVSVMEKLDAANQHPIEVIGALRYRPTCSVDLTAGAGAGVTRGYASPDYRLFAGLNVGGCPTQAPADRDKDGIVDAVDRCPDIPEDKDAFQDEDGCPDADNDGDGVCDPWVVEKGLSETYKGACQGTDQCPDVAEDKDGFQDQDGCRDADNDGDGICDPWVAEKGLSGQYQGTCRGTDKCPDAAEDKDGFQDEDGCPDADNDGDGICDPWVAAKGLSDTYKATCRGTDKCPDQPETVNGVDDDDGCPDALARVEGKKIIILDKIYFDFDKATIQARSLPVVDAVQKILKEHPEITKVRCEAHTDSKGSAGYNQGLSQRRAAAVVKALVDGGIDKARLAGQGFGGSRPLVKPEKTDEDRQQNRRVEFVIVESGEAR